MTAALDDYPPRAGTPPTIFRLAEPWEIDIPLSRLTPRQR